MENQETNTVNLIEAYLLLRIGELNKADEEFCKMRWDMEKPAMERKLYRESSNSVTLARQELERTLQEVRKINLKNDPLDIQKSSFAKKEGVIVNCCKCEKTINDSEDSWYVYHDKGDAIEGAKYHEWDVDGELATCLECLREISCNVEAERQAEYDRQKMEPYH